MLFKKTWIVAIVVSLIYFQLNTGYAQSANRSYITVSEVEPLDSIVKKAAHVVPAPRQVMWQELELTCFYHFGINTFYNYEWGNKEQMAEMFNPTAFDANQWAVAAKSAGARMMLCLAKHHDGFCLWPTKYTDFSVKSSPWKNGKGDLIDELSKAARTHGLKFGIYLSPWDIHSPVYGTDEYNEVFRNQLRELLTGYGQIDEVWFDGACGEGPNGKRQVYDWEGFYKVIRELQPQAVIAVMGPDVRWVGTESGYGRTTEWSVVPASAAVLEDIALSSQQNPGNGAFMPVGNMMDEDLGSRDKLSKAEGMMWYPSEVDVSIRPGWFYHEREDSLVKSAEKLVDIYYSSVGRNSLLLLNLPADRRGLIHENDLRSLRGMKVILDATFRINLLEGGTCEGNVEVVRQLTDSNTMTYWSPGEGRTTGALTVEMPGKQTFDRVLLQENYQEGQRVEQFVIEAEVNGLWITITSGTTIGYKRLLRFEPVSAQRIRLRILSARDCPQIGTFGLFKAPEG
ncbi:MAG TPA: alpha-L-fucosidase [Bacteroidales bacterium]|nr:alpha-L-fucosidase [Bacteroidales bacterium]HBZ65453.1 alpha-L-fucosidase [Bacteroidales bacterium]